MVRNLFVCLTFLACSLTLKAAAPKPAYEILPASTQAVVWLPDSTILTDRWDRTQLSKLADDPQIKEFWQDQQGQIEERLTSAGWRLHIQPRDLTDVVAGQVALAWIERPEVVRKPYALVLIVDVVQHEKEAAQFLEKLDNQLKDRGSQRTQLKHQGFDIAQHTIRTKGELLPQETFYVVVNEQLLASDDLNTLQGLIDAAIGKATDKKLDADPVFKEVREQLQVSKENQVEYFVRPLGFARVLRAISGKRGGGKTDILAVLQAQGFDSLKAVCGEVRLGQENYDLVHRGFVLATGDLKSRPAAVQLLDFPNQVKKELPQWISDRVSSVFATTWNAKEAFWKAEPLVDALAGPNVFREIIDGIRVDPKGPQIDIRKEVLPLLTNEIYAISEAKEPLDEKSKRNLIALRVTDSKEMSRILDKAMRQETDATEIKLGGKYTAWKVQHKEEEELDIGEDFQQFAKKQGNNAPAQNQNGNQPLLSDWAITVHDGFLLFASHEDVIEEAIKQSSAAASPLASQADYLSIAAALEQETSNAPICAWRINRSAIAYRAQYELFKQGKLGAKGMFAVLIENLLENNSELEVQQPKKVIVNGAKLPAFDAIKKYLHPSGTYARSLDNGWSYGTVLLSSTQVPTPKENDGAANAANKPQQNAATNR